MSVDSGGAALFTELNRGTEAGAISTAKDTCLWAEADFDTEEAAVPDGGDVAGEEDW